MGKCNCFNDVDVLHHIIPILESPKRQIDIINSTKSFKLTSKKKKKEVLVCLFCGFENKLNIRKCSSCGNKTRGKRGRKPRKLAKNTINIQKKDNKYNSFHKKTIETEEVSLPKNKKHKNKIISWMSHTSKPVLNRLVKEKIIIKTCGVPRGVFYKLNEKKITELFFQKTFEIFQRKKERNNFQKEVKKMINVLEVDDFDFEEEVLFVIEKLILENMNFLSVNNWKDILFENGVFSPPFKTFVGFLHFCFLNAVIDSRLLFWDNMEKNSFEEYQKNDGFLKTLSLRFFKNKLWDFVGRSNFSKKYKTIDTYSTNVLATLYSKYFNFDDFSKHGFFTSGVLSNLNGVGVMKGKKEDFFKLIEVGIPVPSGTTILSFSTLFELDVVGKIRFLLKL